MNDIHGAIKLALAVALFLDWIAEILTAIVFRWGAAMKREVEYITPSADRIDVALRWARLLEAI